MSVTLDSEVFLRLLQEVKTQKEQERRRVTFQGDMAKIHLALGGEMACEELLRKLKWYLESRERMRQDEEQKRRTRELRRRQRELAKHPA